MNYKRIAAGAICTAFLALAPAGAARAGVQAPVCDPFDSRTYTSLGYTWYAYDGGTLDNTSAGTISKSYTHSSNQSFTTTVSAEVGAKANVVVAEVNAKFGVSAAVTASYTTSTTFTVTAPPRTKVTYRDGIIKRQYQVKRVQGFTNCSTTTSYGSTVVADNYSIAS